MREALGGAGLTVEIAGDALWVERPTRDDGEDVRVDVRDFLDSLPEEGREARRSVSAFASGIRHALLEPPESDAAEQTFTEIAGRLGMALHAEPFAAGVEATAGSPAWTSPLVDDLRFVCLIELDAGTRVVTEDQFDRWSATEDRLISGARSMLFHKAQHTAPEAVDSFESVERLRIGDGYDAARILVLADLMFSELDRSSRVAVPTSNDLYLVREGSDDGVAELERAVEQRVARSDYPLTTKLFRLERGRPETVGGAP